MDFKKLKSGSDVRGVAMGDNTVLTPETAETLGRAFVAFLAQRLLKKPEQLTIAVGRDSRLSGPQLLQGVVKGITSTGATIVTDSVTSSGLADFIQEWGGVHYRYKRGYRNVIDEAVRLNEAGVNCPLAIETSGHAALRSNHFLDDGMYLVTVLLIKAMQLKQQGEDLSKLLDGLKEPVESREIRLNVVAEDFAPAARQLIERLMEYATEHEEWHIAPDNREGVRISFDIDNQLNAAWFLLRLSVHDPVMPLNAESDVPGGVRYVLGKLYEAIQGETDVVDLSPLRTALQ